MQTTYTINKQTTQSQKTKVMGIEARHRKVFTILPSPSKKFMFIADGVEFNNNTNKFKVSKEWKLIIGELTAKGMKDIATEILKAVKDKSIAEREVIPTQSHTIFNRDFRPYWEGRWEKHNDSANQHKYYVVVAEDGEPVTYYGRIEGYGKAGTRMRFVNDIITITDKIRKKERDGYIRIN